MQKLDFSDPLLLSVFQLLILLEHEQVVVGLLVPQGCRPGVLLIVSALGLMLEIKLPPLFHELELAVGLNLIDFDVVLGSQVDELLL